MKKILIKIGAFLYFAFIFLSLLTYQKEYEVIPTFEEVNGYIKDDFYFKNLSLEEYKAMFIEYNEKDYQINALAIDNNYHNYVKEEINNIQIEDGNYLKALEEYLEKYAVILDKYQMEDEKAKIINGKINIIKISLICTKDIYNDLKKITRL